jgi:hypothetical protein
MSRGRPLSFLALLGALLLLSACGGSSKVIVKGKILQAGQPIKLSKTGVVQITLVPQIEESKRTNVVGRGKPDGSFEISGVTAGKYRIGVEVLDPDPRQDRLNGAFSAANTKIERQLDGKAPVEIDISRPEG